MRTVIFDLETFTLEADTALLLCCSYKEYHHGRVQTVRADAFPNWDGRRSNMRPVVAAVLKALSDFDIFVAHNGLWFDRKMLVSWGLRYDLPLYMRFSKFIDPLQLARRQLRLSRNNLGAVLDFMGIDESKTPIKWDHWKRAAYDRDRRSMNYIVEHCEQDVLVLETAYHRMRKLVRDINEKGSWF